MDETAYLAVLEFQVGDTAEVEREYLVILQQVELMVLEHGSQGPPGPPGPAGGVALQRSAGEVLSALRAVYDLDGRAFYLDYRDAEHIDLLLGITLTAAGEGDPVNIQRLGVLEDSNWNWPPGRVYLGANGALTQTPADDGFHVLIGAATAPNRITLNLSDPIELEG
ncbi:DUF2190 family protein [Pseudomonas sp. ML96]|uniref:DUF2190 family protein n=1 Tax=Pseudomonas sp. ML96 TaxID=1523503 RepID=UPI0005B8D062|nr:DUF2190 family protein [Pseudomonas sp. ML96]